MLRPKILIDIPKVLRRNVGILAPVMSKTADPIQQLFVDKIREFRDQSKAGKITMSPHMAKLKQQEIEKTAKQFGAEKGTDMTQFPQFKFPEPTVEIYTPEPAKPAEEKEKKEEDTK